MKRVEFLLSWGEEMNFVSEILLSGKTQKSIKILLEAP